MHPAFSVVFFTTASGAGYGLLAWIGVFAAFGALPHTRPFGAVALGVALALVTAGLLSSTAHLTHPERAWRAFSQWRSSWLSREGVMSVATYAPTGLFALGWVVFGSLGAAVTLAGLVAALCAILTVCTTGMIYASLKPIAEWRSPFTAPGYLIYSLMSGAVLLNAALAVFGAPQRAVSLLAIGLIALGWSWKTASWRHNDRLAPIATANSATGLKRGAVRSIEWPHTEENYVLKEMGYRIARKHAAKLRLFVHAFAFALPLIATVIVIMAGGLIAAVAAVVAAIAIAAGLLVERWLFFAEAKHTVTLYYGR
jgi:DMSO reductase anchor subunit